ncbi:MAG: type II CAAX endopeptidase family protein [Phormidesmis sp.]
MGSPSIKKLKDWVEDWARNQGAWWRIFAFLGVIALVWVPIAAVVYLAGYFLGRQGVAEITALVMLYGLFLKELPRWGRQVHAWALPLRRCGLVLARQTVRDLAIAMLIGVLGVFLLFGVETLFGWASPVTPSPKLARFILEGLIMSLAVGFAEEMMFRGWVLAELEETYPSTVALVMNALFFAGTHFIKPWAEIVRTFPQFLGLVILGLALVWGRRTVTGDHTQKTSRLGYPIGLHAGLIWGYYMVNVGGLSEYTGRVPEWVTGVDDNPLAGLLGILLLSAIAYQFAKVAEKKTQPTQP